MTQFSAIPAATGLYDPSFEHDACGVAFVATMTGIPSHDIVVKAIQALVNLDHRGAAGAEPNSGDGAGILIQVPDAFLRGTVDFDLPPQGEYAVGTAFLPPDVNERRHVMAAVERLTEEEHLVVLGWREVPIHADPVGVTARSAMPAFHQLFVAPRQAGLDQLALERRVYCLRKRAEREAEVYFPSLSSRTLVYKGMLTTGQLEQFFPDLSDPRIASALAIVHSRFSTNTFPSWSLAHPFRLIAHNGEINTVRGNRNWMRAREAQLNSDLIPGDIRRILPICTAEASDSASFDEVVELLHMAGQKPAARGAHDDPGGLGEPRRDGPGAPGVLRVPLQPDGALGRPCVDQLHRRHRHRLGARPQRPAPGTVLGDRGRAGRPGLGSRCARHRPGDGGAQGAAAAGPDVPGRHRCRPDHRGRGGQGRARRGAPVLRLAARRHGAPRGAARARARRAHGQVGGPPSADVRLHRGGAADPAHADGAQRPRGAGVDGHRHARSRSCRTARGCSSTTSRSCSPRSPTRRWTPSARRSSRHWAATWVPRGTCWRPRPRTVGRSCCRSR